MRELKADAVYNLRALVRSPRPDIDASRMGKPRTPSIFTSPQDAALAFYQAFEAKDIDAMMATWAEDEDIVCVHPGGPRLVGYDAVRASWDRIFAGDGRVSFRLEQVVMIETVGLAMQSAIEHIHAGDGQRAGGRARHERLHAHAVGMADRVHHASSAAPPMAEAEKKGPLH